MGGTPKDKPRSVAETMPAGSGQLVSGDGVTAVATATGAGGRGGHLPADPDLVIGEYVGEYAIESILGRGGFGTVYCAAHPVIGKRVAIKVLARKYSADEAIVSRFISEARAVNQIRHRNVVDIFSFGKLSDGRAYYVMEHLEGEPLDRHLALHGPLTVEAALPILVPIARALDAAHAKGIAHRDLKPENIFIARDDDGGVFPKLLDFGIAKLLGQEETLAHKTHTGVPIGTPYYMSPEQCRGRDVDHRTDIYSFGVLVYRMVTGTYPFEGEMVEILHRHMHEEPEPPSARTRVPAHVDAAIAWMMRKAPAARPHSVGAAIAALRGERTSAPAITPDLPPGSTSAVGSIGTPVSRVLPTAPQPPRRWIAPAVLATVIAGGTAAYFAMPRDRAVGHGAATDAMLGVPVPIDAMRDAAVDAVIVDAVIDAAVIDAAVIPDAAPRKRKRPDPTSRPTEGSGEPDTDDILPMPGR